MNFQFGKYLMEHKNHFVEVLKLALKQLIVSALTSGLMMYAK
jgi:hypothetical protein